MNKDKIIEKNIKEKLEKERVSYGVDINVRCINGHVTLYGIVDNLSKKNHAQKIAESVEYKGKIRKGKGVLRSRCKCPVYQWSCNFVWNSR